MESAANPSKTKHALKLLTSLDKMKKDQVVCDFAIIVGESYLPVHRTVLVAFSKYFAEMFSTDAQTDQQDCIEMHNLSPGAVKTCIQFMYTGEVNIVLLEMSDVLEASQFMQLEDLTDRYLQYLRDNLDGKTCLLALRLFRTYGKNQDQGQGLAEQCAIKNLGIAMETEDFFFIRFKDLRRYVNEADMDPEKLWKGVVMWLKSNVEEGEKNLPEIVGDVLKKNGVTLEFVVQVVWKDPFVKSNNAAQSIVLSAITENDIVSESNMTLELSFEIKNILACMARSDCPANKDLIERIVDKNLATNFAKIVCLEKFNRLSFKDVSAILQSNHLVCKVETMKWEAILKWVMHNQTREEKLPDFLKLINFSAIPMSYTQNTIRTHSLIERSAICKEILLDEVLLRVPKKINEEALPAEKNNLELSTMVAMDARSGVISAIDLVNKNQVEITKIEKKKFCSIASVCDNLYVLRDEDIFQYSPKGSWKKLQTWHLESTATPQIVVFQKKIYSVGKIVLSSYDPSRNLLKQPNKGCGLEEGFCVASSSDSIYALGGDGTWKDARRWDTEAQNWIALAMMGSNRAEAGAAVYQDNLYVMGGLPITGLKHRSVECYSKSEDSWTYLKNMEKSRDWCGAVVYKDTLYAVGGACWMNKKQTKNSIEAYDKDTDKWSVVCDLQTQADRVIACVWKGVDMESLRPATAKDNYLCL